MMSSRFSLRFGWYVPLLLILSVLWVLSLGPGLVDPSPYAPYRIYFPPASHEITAETDSLKQMAIFSVEQTRRYNWNYQLFSALCHSKPERSIFLNGVQMPVNSRCSGIFSGLLVGIVLIPLFGHRFYRKKWVVSLLGLMVIFQIIDVIGNSLEWWMNSTASRWVIGFPLGLFIIVTLTDLFVCLRSKDG